MPTVHGNIVAVEDFVRSIEGMELGFRDGTPKEDLKKYRNKLLYIVDLFDVLIDENDNMFVRSTMSLDKYSYPAWCPDSVMFSSRDFYDYVMRSKISKALHESEKLVDARICLASSGAMRYVWSQEAPIGQYVFNEDIPHIGKDIYKEGFF